MCGANSSGGGGRAAIGGGDGERERLPLTLPNERDEPPNVGDVVRNVHPRNEPSGESSGDGRER